VGSRISRQTRSLYRRSVKSCEVALSVSGFIPARQVREQVADSP
jgi:hypothetical protein